MTADVAGRRRVDPVRSTRSLACLLLVTSLAGCVTTAPLDAMAPADAPRRVELTATPFFPQDDHQCGPAALSTLLAAAGVDVQPDDLVAEVYLPGRQGSLQAELLAAARRRGRMAYTLAGTPDALLAELQAGRPVLVLQNLGIDAVPVWHYAVVVGYDADRDEVILRSGRERRQVTAWARFEGSWRRAGRWAVVLLEPGTLPARPDALVYLEGCAGLEAAGQSGAAERAYAAAAQRWPEEPLAHLGMGNAAYARDDFVAAVRSYRRGVDLDADHAALRNNLAQALLDAGCPGEAEVEARRASRLARGTPLEADAADTLASIVEARRQAPDAGRCEAVSEGIAPGQPLSSGDESSD